MLHPNNLSLNLLGAALDKPGIAALITKRVNHKPIPGLCLLVIFSVVSFSAGPSVKVAYPCKDFIINGKGKGIL